MISNTSFRLPTAGDGISPAILFPSSDGVEQAAAGLLQEAGGMASTPESSGSRGFQRLRHPPPAPPRAAAAPTQRPRAPSAARLHGHRARRPPPRRKQGRGGWSRVGELDRAPGSGELEGAEPRIERPSTESSPCSSRAGRGSRGTKHRGGEPPPA
jgi:hypothetical protein